MALFDRIKRMFILTVDQLQDPYYQGVAAQVAFYFMLSIVPTLILLSQLLGFIHISLNDIAEYFELEVTPEFLTRIQSMFRYESKTSINIILIIGAIWASSRLQFNLMRVTNYTLSEGKDPGTFFRDRGRSLGTIIVTIVGLVLLIVLVVYGQVALNFLEKIFPVLVRVGGVWRIIKWPVAGGVYLLFISFNYYVLPHNRGRFRDVIPGSIFCAIGMVIVTMIYSAYTNSAVSHHVIYGSMASFAALMFWFYFISWVLILGIFFNKVWSDTRPR